MSLNLRKVKNFVSIFSASLKAGLKHPIKLGIGGGILVSFYRFVSAGIKIKKLNFGFHERKFFNCYKWRHYAKKVKVGVNSIKKIKKFSIC